jgi:hypothetical protein
MMSLAQIHELSQDAARDAAEEGLIPFVVEIQDIQGWRENGGGFPFPNLGDYVPPGWVKTNEYFVNSSGWGASDEPALTARQFIEKLQPGLGYAITEVGQFQLYVGEFKDCSERPYKGKARQ